MHAAETAWLGVDVSPNGPDINVVGYAVDGRPEPKVEPPKPETKDVAEVAAKFASPNADYDDYEEITGDEQGGEFAQFAEASAEAARRVGRELPRRWRDLKDAVVERIRHSDR